MQLIQLIDAKNPHYLWLITVKHTKKHGFIH